MKMKTTLSTLAAMAVAGASLVAFGAQQVPQEPPQPPAVKLTGCLQKADTEPADTEFLLVNVQAPSGHDRYIVKPKDKNVLLSSHVGHQVELTGTVEETGSGTQKTATLTATEVRMVAATCSKDGTGGA